LAVAALDAFLLAAQPERLPQKQPRGAVAGIRKVRFLRLAVGEAAGAGRVVQPKALQQLGIVIELAAIPQFQAEKGAGGPGLSGLRPWREAVLAEIGRPKRRITLLDVGGLPVDLPIRELRL